MNEGEGGVIRSEAGRRDLKVETLEADLIVVGGGLSGLCCAITAARQGTRVVLVQDRPVLGGNASSEVRLWVLGATSHMGNNNRWAREGGVIDEILVENLWRNPEGNAVVFDSLLLEKAISEPNLKLLLNTAVHSVTMNASETHICSAEAFCSQNQTSYQLFAPLFCDASGDGILGFLAGAAFRMGAEGRAEFGEGLAPNQETQEVLGHSLYFYSRDTGVPVRYVAPKFAQKDIAEILRFRELRVSDSGCRLWWIEYGGRLDTVLQTEEIKWELWRAAYGVWNYIKNSGKFPGAETLALEWFGMIPGKRESRRFEGDIILRQQDIVEQTQHPDVVSFGGWAMDLHPADGIYSTEPSCTQWHAKGIYAIPYRALYSRNIVNLFLTGRLISASHIAFGSTRVMATCAHNGQAAGMAAALCCRYGIEPRELLRTERVPQLQQELLRTGHYLPGIAAQDDADMAKRAVITASSSFKLGQLPQDGTTTPLDIARAMLLPLATGKLPKFTITVDVDHEETVLTAELRKSSKAGNYTPDVLIDRVSLPLKPGKQQKAELGFDPDPWPDEDYAFLVFQANPSIAIHLSSLRVTGVLSLSQSMNGAVAKDSLQTPPPGSGVDGFPFWLPGRRPGGKNLALGIDPPLFAWNVEHVSNGFARPYRRANAWAAADDDPLPWIKLEWDDPQTLKRFELSFDTDFDHPMESVLMTHPECVAPFCVRSYRICSAESEILAEITDNHQTRNQIVLEQSICTRSIMIEITGTHGAPAAIFEVRCYAD